MHVPGTNEGRTERQVALEVLPSFWDDMLSDHRGKFSYLVAVIATSVSASKDCLGAEAQENQEKKKKE